MWNVSGIGKRGLRTLLTRGIGGGLLVLATACNPLSGGKSGSEVSSNFMPGFTPSIPLEVRLTDMPSVLRGGQTVNVSFTLPSEMISGDLEYSSDGVNFMALSALTPVDYTYSWSVPIAETLLGVLRIRVYDEYGRVNSVTSRTFIIDSTPPASPVVSVATSNPTNALSIGLTIASCSDRPSIYVSSSSTAPAFDASGWQTCSEGAGVITHSLAAGDGTKSLYVFAQDSVGNVSNPSMVSIVLDQTMPNLSLTSSPTSLKGGASFVVSWTASDALSGLSSFNLAYAADGSTFTSVANFVSSDTSYSWTVPNDSTSAAKLKLTAMDIAGNSRVVTSSAFTIDSAGPLLTLVSPSTVLKGGSTLAVSLSATDALSGVNSFKLQYAADGSTFSDVAMLANLATNYSWTVPSDNATTAKLRVLATDVAGNSSSLSSSSFTIDSTNPTLTLSSLTGGQVVGGGVATSINWSGSDLNTGTAPIKIEVSSDGGGSWSTLVAAMANAGTYSWTTPSVTSTTYRIRVTFTDAAGNAATVASTSNFSVNSSSPITNVTSPNGGETWKGGSTKNITWSSSGLPAGASTAKIEYSLNNGSTYTTIASGLANSAGSNTYSWTVPSATDSIQGRVRVTVTDSFAVDVADASDSAFAIDSTNPSLTLTSLTGGQTLSGGTTANITWTATDTNPGSNTVSLDYSSDGGSNWTSIATGLSNSGSYAWSVPSVTSTTYRVRVTYADAAGNSSSSASSSNFRINSSNPVVAVTAPNGGENLKGGDTTTIMWNSSGLPAGVATADLEYSTDGTTWTSIASGQSNSGTYSWTIPSINSMSVKVRVSVTDSFGIVTADASNSNFAIDSLAPSVALTDPAGPYRGGASLSVSLSASDSGSGLLTYKFQYASNGTTFSDVATLANTDTSYNWTIPAANTTTAKVRVYAVDAAGNVSVQTSAAFTIDSTAPSAPSATLASANPTNSTSATLTIASCTDRISIYVGNTSTVPAYNAAGWQACSTGAGAITNTLTAGDATKTMYVFAQDAVGNVSSASTVSTVLDQTLPGSPAITFAGSGTTSFGGTSAALTLTVSSCTDRAKVLISESGSAPTAGDSAWQNCSTTVGAITHTLSSTSSGAHALKAWAKDSANNISATATNLSYSIDNDVPTISSFTLAGGATNVANPTVAIAITASDPTSALAGMCLSETSSCTDWRPYAASGQNFNLSQTNGTKTVTLWVRDVALNVSATATYTITLDFGSPPTVAITSPVAGANYTTGQTVPIAWTCSSPNGLAAQPISKIEYTTDEGVTFVTPAIATNLTNNDSSTSGHYDWTLPAGVSSFRILVSCKSLAGVVSSAYSPNINTPWSIFMGDPNYSLQNVNALTVNAGWSGSDSSLTGDSAGNVYYVKGAAVMKIDAITGLVTPVVGEINTWSCATGSGAAGRFLHAPTILGTDSARLSILIHSRNCGVIYSYDTLSGTLSQWTTIPNTASGQSFLTKNRILLYFVSAVLYKLDLSSPNGVPTAIYGNGAVATITGRYPFGTVVTGLQIARMHPTNGATFQDTFLAANDDASKIWINTLNFTGGYRIDLGAGGNYSIGVETLPDASQRQKCVYSDFDSQIYCSIRSLSPGGRVIYRFDPSTEAWVSSFTLPYDNSDDSGNLQVGVASDRILATYSPNGVFSIVPNTTSTWSYTRIGGPYLATYGNGSDPSLVAFDAPTDIKYVAATQSLLVRNQSGHIRKVDFATNPYSTSTYFVQYLPNTSSTGSNFYPNLAGTKFTSSYSCGRAYVKTFTRSGSSITADTTYPLIGPCDATSGPVYPPVTGAPAGSPTANTTSTIFYSGNMTFTSNFVPHSSDGHVYFYAFNGTSDVFVFKSDSSTLTRIAGKTGVGGYNAADHGNLALGASLTRVLQMQEIASGTYAGDLLIWDSNRLRRISVKTESANPRIYDVVNFTIAAGYTPGWTGLYDAYYDQSTEQGGVLGTGTTYYVTNTSVVRKFVPNAALTSGTDTAYAFTGTTLTGYVRIALTPAGLLVLQPSKARILRITP